MHPRTPLARCPAIAPEPRLAAATRRRALALAALFLVAAPRPAFADDVEQARILFDRGVADMEARAFESACPAIAQSFRLDPRPGTLFTLAECEAQRGRLATAVARYTEFLAVYRNFTPKKQAEQKERATTCTAQIAALAPHVPTLTLRLPEGAPEDVLVKRRGELIPAPSIGTPLALDPGEHVITTEVPGGPVVEHAVSLQKGDKKELRLTVKLEPDAPSDPIPPPAATPVTTVAPPAQPSPHLPGLPRPPSPAPPPDVLPYQIGAAAAGSVGLAGIVVGAVTGLLAIDRKQVVDSDCTRTSSSYVCSRAGFEAGQRLKELGDASTATLVVGLAGLAASGALLLAMPRSGPAARAPGASSAPTLGLAVTPSSLLVRGTF